MSDKKMPSLDTLFGGCSAETKGHSQIEMIETDTLFPFAEHPFLVKDNEDLKDLIQSIKDEGILIPLLVRVHPAMKGKFEILAGHRRHTAASSIGIKQVPCVIKNVDDDTATLIVIESNKQRGFSDMLPSEIAKALKLEHDALKCQGRRTDLFKELEDVLNERKTAENSETDIGDSEVCSTSRHSGGNMPERNRQRYIRLTYLISDLLQMVDDKKIALLPAVDLSFLIRQEQETVFRFLDGYTYTLDGKKAAALKQCPQEKKFRVKLAEDIITGRYFKKPAKKATTIKLAYKSLSNYVDTGQRETKKILSLVIVKYRVKILIPESEIWAVGDDRPSYVARGMIGATVDFVITNIDREGEVAIASRSMANHKRRRLFDSRKNNHGSGDIVPCRMLVVGPKKCLVECGGYDISLSQRDLSYTAIADLRTDYHTGQELQAVIKEFSPKESKLLISVKEINPNPFDGAERRHPIGSRRQGVISGKYKGGIFCTLSDKVVCLCLYSNAHFDTEFFTGDRVLIQITQYDYSRQLIYGRIVTKL